MKKDPMLHYLEKYVGTYRVLPELDPVTNDFPRTGSGAIDASYDDLYIPCTKGRIKNSSDFGFLVWYTEKPALGRKIKNEFNEKGIKIYKYDEDDADVMIWFKEEDINKVAKIVKPKTNGKKINPFSKRNLTKEKQLVYKIPPEDLDKFSNITKELELGEKLKFGKIIAKEFKYDVTEQKDSGLNYKEYVHSIGKWDELIEFTEKKYEELYN